ncbi:MAG: outer membrane receptor for ferrienterochelin and colicin [bacterium P3]|nr:MAG: outer membrane receptor for ferrienterochelin and colicin [bacterium P3]KWW42404.1 MAG: outer membrane receptor for ferrienterochelin and colicin [bacterium F083]
MICGHRGLALLLAVLCMPFMAAAQCTVKGVLYDEDNGEAIPFANVVLDGTAHGAATDLNGFFLINRVPAGTYTLRVRYVGYDEYTETFTLSGRQTLTKSIRLKSRARQLESVVVTESRSEERRSQTQVSVEKITASQIQQMPSIGGQGDLAQYLQVLPGVNSTGDQGGQLYIRGGSMIQNLCMLDGMIVYNPFHSIGLYSVFETDIILNANVFTGGFGAEYGGRLSSVMDITTRDGNKRRHSGKVGFNTFGASALLEGPLKRETATGKSTVTYILSAKNSYLSKTSASLYPYTDNGLPYDFLDLYGKLSVNSGSGSKISFFGFRFDDSVSQYQAIADYHWRNYGMGTNFVLVTGTSSLLEGTMAYSDYRIELDDGSGRERHSGINGFNMNIGVTNFHGNSKMRYGIAMEQYSTDYSFYNAYNLRTTQEEHTNNISLYMTYHTQRGKWLLDPGVRYIYYSSLSEGSFEPRLALKHNATDRLRFKLAGGFYSQVFLDARSDNDIVNLFNGFLTGSGDLNKPGTFRGENTNGCVQRAQHLIVGIEYDFTRHLNVNIEAYYKRFKQLLNANHNKMYDRNDAAYTTPGSAYYKEQYYLTDYMIEDGVAYGLDMTLCYDIDRLYVWATYSLGNVERTDEIQTYHPHYDRRHTVNLMVSYALGRQREWEISARWSYGSGFPFTQTQGVYEQLSSGRIAHDYTTTNGSHGVYYAALYGGRLPDYHRLDIGAKRKFSVGSRSLLEVSLGVTNVYNRKNMFYFDRMTFERVNQLPFLWSAGMNFSF